MSSTRTEEKEGWFASAITPMVKLICDFAYVSYRLLLMLYRKQPLILCSLLLLIGAQGFLPYWRWKWMGNMIDSSTSSEGLSAALYPWLMFSVLVVAVLIVELLVKKLNFSLEQHFSEAFAPFLPRARQLFGMSSFQRGSTVYNSLNAAERAEYSARFLVKGQFPLFGRLLALVVGIWVIVAYAPTIGWIIAAASLVILIVEIACSVRIARFERACWSDMAESTNLKNQFTYRERLKCLILFGMSDMIIERVQQLTQKVTTSLRRINTKLLPIELLSAIALACAFAGSTWMLLSMCVHDALTKGQLAYLVATMITVGMSMKGVIETTAQQALGTDKLVDLFRFMHSKTAPTATSGEEGRLSTSVATPIEVRHLTFEYEVGRPVLVDVCASFKAGETTYLLGSNGVGKTTLLNVVSKVYPIPRGAVFCNGIDTATISSSSLQNSIKHLGQDSLHIRHSVRDLLAMAAGISNVDETRTTAVEDMMWKVLEWACLDGKVRSFRRGLDEPMAIWREAEEDLSGGQHRKLNIAMLFMGILFGNVSVVILDEPFFGIEPKHAKKILARFQELPVTLIVVTHRAEMIPPDASVVFLHRSEGDSSDGKTQIYSGSHGDLLRTCPPYVEYCSFNEHWLELLLKQQREPAQIAP